jgi:hypothetical protein
MNQAADARRTRKRWIALAMALGAGLLVYGCNTYVGLDIGTGWGNVGGLNVGGSVHLGRWM